MNSINLPSESKIKAVIFDIDGTLAQIEHRRHHVASGKKKNWKAFFAEMNKDPVNEWCRNLNHMYKKEGYKIIVMSGRPSNYREVTKTWLSDNNVHYDELFMRDSRDQRQDNLVKEDLYNNHVKSYYQIEVVIDDRKQVVDMWRKIGLVCLQCDFGEF